MRFLAGRALHGLALLAAVSALSFVLAQLAPGDYFSELKLDPRVSSAAVDGLRARAGLDRPLPVRYWQWVTAMARGDFGYSLAYNGPVAPLLWQRMRATLLLTGASTLLAWLLAVPLGIWAATVRGTWRDAISNAVLSFWMSVPDLLVAIALLVFAVESGLFPAGGMTSPGFANMGTAERLGDILRRMALPVAALALGTAPALTRHVRAAMLEAMDAPFALAATAQGIPRRRRLFRHLLPAALNPLITLFGVSLGTLLSGSLLVEVVMGWPGLGPLFLDAIMSRDLAIVLAVVMLSAAFLVAGNLAADLLLYRADPRIRVK